MAENQADDDDDEGFGDFKFVSPSFNPSPSMFQDNGVEDEWGDFMDNFSQKPDFFGNPPQIFTQTLNPTNPPQSLQSLDLFGDFSNHSTETTDSKLNHVESEKDSASPIARTRWEKPQGAIPLSIFGEEEKEEEPDSNNPSFNDTADLFSAKNLSSPVKNEVSFGTGLRLDDLIVNLYSQADQIKIENGSNSNSNTVDRDENFDDEGWQFKDASCQDEVGDRDSAVEIKVTSGLSGAQVETTTRTSTDQKFQVNGKLSKHSEGTSNKSGLSNGGQDSGDIFAASDWFSHKSAGNDNGLGFFTSIATQNGSEGTSNKSGLSNGGQDSGDTFAASDWLSHRSAGHDNGHGFVTSIATQNGSEGTKNKLGLSNGGQDSGDIFAASDWLSHRSAGLDNGLGFVTSIASQNGSEGTSNKSGLSNGGQDSGYIFAASDWFSHKSVGLDNGLGFVTSVATQNGSEATSNKSGLSNGGQDSGDIFAASDWLSPKSAGFDNDVGFVTSIATQNGSTSEPFNHDKQSTTGNGSNSKVGDGNVDTDDDFWDFKDAFSESEGVNCFSGNKEEQTGTGFSDADVKVLAFDSEVHGNGKELRDHQESLSVSFFSDGKLDADDALYAEDVSSHKPANPVRNGTYGWGSDPNVSLTDLISTLYSQAEGIPAVTSTKKPTGDELSSAEVGVTADLVNGNNDVKENSWEFKDAFSETQVKDEFSSIPVSVGSVNSIRKPTEAQVGLNSDVVNGEDDFCEFKDASSEIKAEGQSYVFNLSDMDQRFLSDSRLKNFMDFYSRLKEESCIAALHHLDCLKKSHKVAAISGEDVKAMALHEEIQAAYKKLHKEDLISEEIHSEELSARNICANEFMNDTTFQVLESEYELSKRISLAENDLTSAIELFEHAILMQKILSVGSVEEQSKYITTWLKMISVCAQELIHGAFIWKQSALKTVHKKILSELQGQKYFLALTEIYRVVEVLRASTILYKPWILSNLVDPSLIFVLLEECLNVWSDSGLEEAVRSIPDPIDVGYNGTIKELLESIKSIHDLDAVALQSQVFSLKEPICQLSGLSHAAVPDMKVVSWDGGHYFLTLANLWANRISSDPPKTSRLHISDDGHS